jgi:hypothetical protein
VPLLQDYSAWDLLLAGALAAIGLLAVGRRSERIPAVTWAISLGIAVAGFALLEMKARRHPERGVVIAHPSVQPITFVDDGHDDGVCALFPEDADCQCFPGLRSRDERPRRPGVRRVLHIGDSIVGAGDAAAGTTFEEVLARSLGDEEMNLGTSNTGTDFELLIVRKWVDRLRPDEVVLHVFINDVAEIDRPFYWCDAGPLLGEGDGLPARCRGIRPPTAARARLRHSPTPLALRLPGHYSEVFHQLTARMERRLRANLQPTEGSERAWTRFGQMLAAIRDELARRHVPLRVIVLPNQNEVLHDQPDGVAPRMLDVARRLGLDAHDPFEVLRRAVAANPNGRWYIGNSPHFDVDGHALYAAWLERELGWRRRPETVSNSDYHFP